MHSRDISALMGVLRIEIHLIIVPYRCRRSGQIQVIPEYARTIVSEVELGEEPSNDLAEYNAGLGGVVKNNPGKLDEMRHIDVVRWWRSLESSDRTRSAQGLVYGTTEMIHQPCE